MRKEKADTVKVIIIIEGRKIKRIRSNIRWMDCIEVDLKRLGVVNWRRMPLKRNDWIKCLKEAKTHPEL